MSKPPVLDRVVSASTAAERTELNELEIEVKELEDPVPVQLQQEA